MNSEIKMIRKFCCSTCGVQGHNKNNTKFHPVDNDLYIEWCIETKGDFDDTHWFQEHKKLATKTYKKFVKDSFNKKEGVKHYTDVKLIRLISVFNDDYGEDWGEVVSTTTFAEWKAPVVEDEDEDDEEETDEDWVDKFESPNVLPYKKCSVCEGRSSCGSYNENRKWICESCAPEEEEADPINGDDAYKIFMMLLDLQADCNIGEFEGKYFDDFSERLTESQIETWRLLQLCQDKFKKEGIENKNLNIVLLEIDEHHQKYSE